MRVKIILCAQDILGKACVIGKACIKCIDGSCLSACCMLYLILNVVVMYDSLPREDMKGFIHMMLFVGIIFVKNSFPVIPDDRPDVTRSE